MTQEEILQEFEQLSLKQQLETLRAALSIIELRFSTSQQQLAALPLAETRATDDPLLALAGSISAPMTVSENHDLYIGDGIKDDNA